MSRTRIYQEKMETQTKIYLTGKFSKTPTKFTFWKIIKIFASNKKGN